MADLFSVTAPLLIRRPDGVSAVMAERFLHPQGLLYFDLFWNLSDPAIIEQALALFSGTG